MLLGERQHSILVSMYTSPSVPPVMFWYRMSISRQLVGWSLQSPRR